MLPVLAVHFDITILFLGQILSLYQFDVSLPLPIIPILLDNVMCTGSETSLLQCFHNGFNNHNCDHSEDIVLACVGKRRTLTGICAYYRWCFHK